MAPTNSTADAAADRPTTRTRLTRESVIAGAVALADELGSVDPLTIRRLADHLGVKPMSIYHHVPNKDQILDGMVDAVFAEIELPSPTGAWRDEMRRRAHSARVALGRHPWATGMLDARTNPGPATLTHHDTVIACLRSNGFDPVQVSHAAAAIDSFVYGFALQEAALPGDGAGDLAELADELLAGFASDYPNLAWLTAEHVQQPDYAFGDEFEFGLELVLDGLARRLEV